MQVSQSVVALQSLRHGPKSRPPPANTAGGAPSHLISPQRRCQWYPLAHGRVNPKQYEGDRATRPALQEERGNLCATRPVGWGYRRRFRSPEFLIFFAVWTVLHVFVCLAVLGYLGNFIMLRSRSWNCGFSTRSRSCGSVLRTRGLQWIERRVAHPSGSRSIVFDGDSRRGGGWPGDGRTETGGWPWFGRVRKDAWVPHVSVFETWGFSVLPFGGAEHHSMKSIATTFSDS